ncbi:hypothetical protein RFI_20999, partial [Reticulomyxa filosa]
MGNDSSQTGIYCTNGHKMDLWIGVAAMTRRLDICSQCEENESKRKAAEELREKLEREYRAREREDRERREREARDFLSRKRKEEKELEKLKRLVREEELRQEEKKRKDKKDEAVKKMRAAFSQPFGRTDEIDFETVMFPLLQLNSTAPAAVNVLKKFAEEVKRCDVTGDVLHEEVESLKTKLKRSLTNSYDEEIKMVIQPVLNRYEGYVGNFTELKKVWKEEVTRAVNTHFNGLQELLPFFETESDIPANAAALLEAKNLLGSLIVAMNNSKKALAV